MINKPSDITCFCWGEDHGVARHSGVTVDLTALPNIQGLPAHLRAIDFVPAVHAAMLRESGQAWREMTASERAVSLGFLARISEVVRRVVA